MAGAVYYGYGVSEILWGKDAGRLVPTSFVNLAPRRFGYRLHDGKFVWKDTGFSSEGIDFLELYPGKFVVTHPRVNGDVPTREGLVRCLVWAALFRNWSLADWLKTAEIAWKPYKYGYYPKDAPNESARDELLDTLTDFHNYGTAAFREGTGVVVEWPGGNQTAKATHAEMFNVVAQEMSKAVLGQTETTQASSSSGYAQAKVHDAVRKDLREARARQIASDITRDVIEPMFRLNFDGVRPPRFQFVTEDAVDLASFANAVSVLAGTGLAIPSAWVREQGGIPEPNDGEEVIGGTPGIPIDVQPPEGPAPSDGQAPLDGSAPPAAA